MNRFLSLLLIFFLGPLMINAQETLLPLLSNPKLAGSEQAAATQKLLAPKQVQLPFRDDFSYAGPYPDQTLWADSFAFINSSFAVHSKTVGVATFDALDQYGRIYEAAQENAYQFAADFLTSQPIMLEGLSPADSVLLTFYYQPQGLSSAPRERDSLVVEFLKTPGFYQEDDEGEMIWIPDVWESVWRVEGESLQTFSNDTFPYFKRAAIFITDPVFFRSDFRFRFRNYSSFQLPVQKTPFNMAGNNNIWNIDYVLLDKNRSKLITTYFDIAFADGASSILKRYTAMPWSHYIVNPAANLKSNLNLKITNLGSTVVNYTYRYFIQDENGNNIRTYSGGPWNLAPFSQDGYQNFPAHANPIVIPNPLPTAPAPMRKFNIVHVVREGATGDIFPRNDTIAFKQVFDNYYAYDDGTPENGYGLAGTNAKGAYRFVLSKPDQLTAVQFYFNRTLDNSNDRPFRLTIWNKLAPEEILYQSEVQTPDFEDTLNGFVTYMLDTPVEVSDTIYVGWEQIAEGFLNIGYDVNSQAGENIFYNVANEWVPSIYTGALLIRPVFGPSGTVSINEIPEKDSITLFPNPLRSPILNIRVDESVFYQPETRLEVYDMHGRLVISQEFVSTLNLEGLSNGMYILRVTHPQSRQSQSSRFIIAR